MCSVGAIGGVETKCPQSNLGRLKKIVRTEDIESNIDRVDTLYCEFGTGICEIVWSFRRLKKESGDERPRLRAS